MDFAPQFGVKNSLDKEKEGLILIFSTNEENLACRGESSRFQVLMECSEAVVTKPLSPFYHIGELGAPGKGRPVCCVSLENETPLPQGWQWVPFRDIFREMDRESQYPVSRGKQILSWERTHRYCGTCGSETETLDHEPCRKCPECGALFYPRFSPAVITRITRGRQIMLAHNGRFPENLYANIAGFVEAGETLEQAVRREIHEEVSLDVENIRYFASQQWPMPNSLMLGFTAECPVGEPVPDGEEITDARWFDPDDLPQLPPPGSIARRMIDDHLKRYLNK